MLVFAICVSGHREYAADTAVALPALSEVRPGAPLSKLPDRAQALTAAEDPGAPPPAKAPATA